jgi:steroid delta-isomerase-like uncharacterized protein
MIDPATSEIVRNYIAAWNRHDGDAVAAAFLPAGVYRDPNVPDGIAGGALRAYVNALTLAFPDLWFEEVFTGASAGGVAVLQWVMRGTNSGPFMARPATGGVIALPGVDLIRLEDGAIASVAGFFDRRTLIEQLGLQVVINPRSAAPVAFGSSSHVEAGDSAAPGGLSLTMIEVRGEEELTRVRVGAARIAPGLPRLAGFLGFLGAALGRRLYTVTAWEHPEQARQIRADPTHLEMVRQVFHENLGTAMHTTTWVPHAVGRFWVRCAACLQLLDVRAGSDCRCGAQVKDVPRFW